MAEEPSPTRLIHYYDEMTEAKAAIPTKDYKNFLIKWGIESAQAERLCSRFDPNKTGFIRREDLYREMPVSGLQPDGINGVQILTSDMKPMQRQSIIFHIIDVLSKKMSKQEQLNHIKQRIENVYGDGWNCYMTDGKFHSVCSHKIGSSLVFVYNNIVIGVYQTPGAGRRTTSH